MLLSRWALTFYGAATLAALFWFLGPLLSVLESWVLRLLIVQATLMAWLIANLLLDRRRRKRDAEIEQGLVASAAAEPGSPNRAAEEAAAIGDKLTAALALLKKARDTRGYLYEQPWYVIIGPPGAGKTTALLNAGLQFPLVAETGEAKVAGVGGTRLCDWWFTDDAVLIDTAGRWATQDSNTEVDRAGWEAFLGLLRKTRPLQPLNGVIVAIALSDIALAGPEERRAHARAIRRRVMELEDRLGIRLPVYALLTKADLIAGFTEFFDDLDREARSQVWGATFPYPPAGEAATAGAAALYPQELRLLVKRLDDRLYDRLQAERGADRRGLIAGFPLQVATLGQSLQGFLAEAFGGSRLEPAPLLRGVYFTSGTQEGAPIDRLTGAMARSFGLGAQRLANLRPEHGRSYFLGRLLRDVIFGEAMLVSEPPATRRQRLLLRGAAFAGVALAVLGLGSALLAARGAGQHDIDAMELALAAYEARAKALPLDPVNDGDLPRLAPLLDAAAKLPDAVAGEGPLLAGFGLDQAEKLRSGARVVYRHALGNALLPRLVWRLEAQMRGLLTQPAVLYEAMRVYLMLGGQGPLDKALVRGWMEADWQANFTGPLNVPVVSSLRRHLDAMLEEPPGQLPLDDALVAQARATFSRVPLANRVYSRIRPSAAAQAVPPWKLSDALGPAGGNVFVRPSGRPPGELTVPGFLTVEGFHRVLLPALPEAMREVATEGWVLGQNLQINLDGGQMKQLADGVVALYEADYARQWDAVLRDIDTVPLRSLSQAAQDMYILSSPASPMRTLLGSIARQVTLSKPPEGHAAATAAVVGAAGAAAQRAAGAAAEFFGTGTAAAAAILPGQRIDERYRALREFVGSGPGAPIDQVLKVLNELQQQLAKLAAAPLGSAPPAGSLGEDPTRALRSEAQRWPEPLNRWLTNMATSGATLRGGDARRQFAAAYGSATGPGALCPLVVNGRYPFVPGVRGNETPPDDFARLFAPGALLDGFFNNQLVPYVETSSSPWKPRAVEGIAPPVTQADVAQFERAAMIRDAFFAGGTSLAARFDIKPLSLDSGATQVTLDFDGTQVVYQHGPPRPVQITWPGPTRMQSVRLVFEPPSPGDTGVMAESGPWALFRLLGRGSIRQGSSPEAYILRFQLGQREASFELRAGSVRNPLVPGLLTEFRCPNVQ